MSKRDRRQLAAATARLLAQVSGVIGHHDRSARRPSPLADWSRCLREFGERVAEGLCDVALRGLYASPLLDPSARRPWARLLRRRSRAPWPQSGWRRFFEAGGREGARCPRAHLRRAISFRCCESASTAADSFRSDRAITGGDYVRNVIAVFSHGLRRGPQPC